MKAIKKVFDPNGVLNPGNIFLYEFPTYRKLRALNFPFKRVSQKTVCAAVDDPRFDIFLLADHRGFEFGVHSAGSETGIAFFEFLTSLMLRISGINFTSVCRCGFLSKTPSMSLARINKSAFVDDRNVIVFNQFGERVERVLARSFVFKIAVSHQTLRRTNAEIAEISL